MNDVLEREGILYGDTAYFMFCTYRAFYYRCALRSEPRLAVTRLNGMAYTILSNVFSSMSVSVAL